MESDYLIKYAYKLSAKALQPSNLERQNVKLVLQIFNDFVSQALNEIGERFGIPHSIDTAAFIKIITTWWDIVNVKTPHKNIRRSNVFQQPLTTIDTEPKLFLREFSCWLSKWAQMKQTCGKLTKETHTAIVHTSEALLKISDYCLNELGAKYVLLGKFQTDSLEARFGQYRQLAGGKYDVSLRQVFECEKKIRLLSVLKLSVQGREITLTDFKLNWDSYNSLEIGQQYPIHVTTEEVNEGKEKLPVLTYIAGYCCYSVNKKLKCEDCKKRIVCCSENSSDCFQTNLIKGISRGGLLYPSHDIIDVVLVCYLTIKKLTEIDSFYRDSSQRRIAVSTCLAVLDGEYMLNDNNFVFCSHHNFTELIKMIVWVCTNTLLNNLCLKKNDEVRIERLSKKRKLRTFN